MRVAIPIKGHSGDVVLDPFCDCGTTIDAAEKLGRDWIGIDVTQRAISLIKNRLQDTYGRRLKFLSGGSRRESAQTSSAPESQSGLTSAATAATARGVHAASTPEHEARSKRAEARAPEGRAGSPLPAAEHGESSASPGGAHGVTRPGNRRESAQTSSAPESQSGLTSAATAATARGVHAASPPEHEATSKRAEARAPEGRAGSPLPAAEPGESSASPDGAQGTARPTRDGAHGVTRPTDVHVVRIIGEPSPSPIMKKRGSPRRFRLHFRAWARSTTATTSTS